MRLVTLFYYGPLVVWMTFIFVMSTGGGDDPNSKELIRRVLEHWAPDLSRSFTPDQIGFINYILRKAGHLAEYFVLMGLSIRAIQFGSAKLKWYAPIIGFALCAIYAASDEYHQGFVAGRSASVTDVMIDVSGALLCLAVMLGWFTVKWLERRMWGQDDASQAGELIEPTRSRMRKALP